MAKFQMELPNQVIKDIQKIYDNSEEIFGEMTRAGADVVNHNIIANVPESIRNSEMMKCLKVTKTYKTPSDDELLLDQINQLVFDQMLLVPSLKLY